MDIRISRHDRGRIKKPEIAKKMVTPSCPVPRVPSILIQKAYRLVGRARPMIGQHHQYRGGTQKIDAYETLVQGPRYIRGAGIKHTITLSTRRGIRLIIGDA